MMQCANRLPVSTPVLRFRPGGLWTPLLILSDSRNGDSRQCCKVELPQSLHKSLAGEGLPRGPRGGTYEEKKIHRQF